MAETIEIGPLKIEFLRTKHDTQGSLDLMRLTVAPSGRMPIAHHHRNWDETVYGLEGCLTFTVAGTAHDIRPGDTLFIPRGVVHGFDNRGGADAVCLAALTPGVLGPEYFHELAALVAHGKPDEAAVREIMRRHGLVPAG